MFCGAFLRSCSRRRGLVRRGPLRFSPHLVRAVEFYALIASPSALAKIAAGGVKLEPVSAAAPHALAASNPIRARRDRESGRDPVTIARHGTPARGVRCPWEARHGEINNRSAPEEGAAQLLRLNTQGTSARGIGGSCTPVGRERDVEAGRGGETATSAAPWVRTPPWDGLRRPTINRWLLMVLPPCRGVACPRGWPRGSPTIPIPAPRGFQVCATERSRRRR